MRHQPRERHVEKSQTSPSRSACLIEGTTTNISAQFSMYAGIESTAAFSCSISTDTSAVTAASDACRWSETWPACGLSPELSSGSDASGCGMHM